MRSLSKHNDNINYILTVIDVFSRYAYAYPIKNKTGDYITEAFQKLFEIQTPKLLQTDKGTEFINKKTQSLFKKHNVKWFTTENLTKAQMVERFNRTLKDRMYKYFTAADTKRWVGGNPGEAEVLQDLVENYNTSYHRTIKMTPEEAVQDPYEVTENTSEKERINQANQSPRSNQVITYEYQSTERLLNEVMKQIIQMKCLLFQRCIKLTHQLIKLLTLKLTKSLVHSMKTNYRFLNQLAFNR